MPSSPGPCPYSEILLTLQNRQAEEKAAISERLRGKGRKKMTPGEALTEFCRLVNQQMTLEREVEFEVATMATGLAERKQLYKPIL